MFYTKSKYFWISCMSVSLLVSLLPYWNHVNIGISPVLDDIYFWIFWRHSWDISALFPKYSVFLVFLSVCHSVSYISSDWSFLGVNFWDFWSCSSSNFICYYVTLAYLYSILPIFIFLCTLLIQFMTSHWDEQQARNVTLPEFSILSERDRQTEWLNIWAK